MSQSEEGILLPIEWLKNARPFKPCARFIPPMNQLTLLNEDAPYRSREFGQFAILYAPDELQPVGVHVFNVHALIASSVHEALTPGELACACVRSLRNRVKRRISRCFR